jgi:hypothetical protein
MRLTIVLTAALLAGSSAAAQEYERALVPIAITDHTLLGALGSEWKTTFAVHNGGADRVLLTYALQQCTQFSPCVNADVIEPGETSFRSGDELPFYLDPNAPGTLVKYLRATGSSLSFTLRIQDISRQALTWGTEIPVIREGEFHSGRLQLLNVPLDARFRLMLRVYGLNKGTGAVAVRFYSVTDGALLQTASLAMLATAPPNSDPSSGPDYAQLGNFVDLFETLRGTSAVRVELEASKPIWAFVSVTNNETQHVTTITPQ